MKIIIDIPEETARYIKNFALVDSDIPIVYRAIISGIVLPKGRGDLIDARKIYDVIAEKEELAKRMVIGTPTNDHYYLRYVTQLSERTEFKELISGFPVVVAADTEVEE